MQIQDIEELRRQEGIDDPELRQQIRGLKRGDFVKLTLLSDPHSAAGETLRVRITSIRGGIFRGKLAGRAVSVNLSEYEAGTPIVFTAAHIHSLSGKQSPVRPMRRVIAH